MPSTQLDIKLGTDNSIFTHDVPANVKRSKFNISRKRDFTMDPGFLVPIDIIETVPGDSFEIKVNYLLKSMPLEVAPFTNYKIRTHWYYCRMVDLWKGAETFITKGRSGAINLELPQIQPYKWKWNNFQGTDEESESATKFKCWYSTPQSLACYMGLPPKVINYPTNTVYTPREVYTTQYYINNNLSKEVNKQISDEVTVNALPFLMYQKIWRMGYLVPNLMQGSKLWFPEDINDGWRIDYDKKNIDCMGHFDNFGPQTDWTQMTNEEKRKLWGYPEGENAAGTSWGNTIHLLELRPILYEDDRFTTALPWAQRGSAPTLNFSDASIDLGSLKGTVDLSSSIISVGTLNNEGVLTGSWTASGGSSSVALSSTNITALSAGSKNFSVRHTNPTGASQGSSFDVNIPSQVIPLSGDAGFSLNQFRELIALSVWQERNARTQGGYNETIYSHFNSSPKHEDYEPRYIGGTSDIITFGEVIQTSSSKDSTPQGTTTGLAQAVAKGDVGYIHCEDYGYIMGVMSIQPETAYTQGLEKLWTRKVMEDFFMPEDEGLGLQEILNEELYVQGNAQDKDLFGYQERNTEYKTRMNQAIGFFALNAEDDAMFSAYTQSRKFTSLPKLSNALMEQGKSLRRDYLAVPSYPAFRISLSSEIEAVRPMAYKNIPNTFGF